MIIILAGYRYSLYQSLCNSLQYNSKGLFGCPDKPAAGTREDSAAAGEEGEDVEQASTDRWELILVNRDHPIPSSWQIERTLLSNGQEVGSRIYPMLQNMFDDARGEGLGLFVATGYRTWEMLHLSF